MSEPKTRDLEFVIRSEGVEVIRKIRMKSVRSRTRVADIIQASESLEEALVEVIDETLTKDVIREMIGDLLSKAVNSVN
jgi:alpha-ketoglutarate-dependent taurine dioxygenase